MIALSITHVAWDMKFCPAGARLLTDFITIYIFGDVDLVPAPEAPEPRIQNEE
jgi:hypothetical protein